MTGTLSWLQISSLSYLATALLISPGGTILPWWLCGIMVALCYGINHFLYGASRQGYGYITLNALACLLFSVIPIISYQYLHATLGSQTLIPAILLFLMVWFSLANAFQNPMKDKTKVMLWEIGIIASSCGMFLSHRYNLNIPYANLIPILIISSGLLNQGLKKREESSGVIRTHEVSNANLLLTLFLPLAGIIGLFAALAVATQRAFGDSGKVFFGRVVDWFQSLGQPMEKQSNPLLSYVLDLSRQHTASIPELGSGAAAPLWVTYTLWAIIALMLVMILVMLIMKVRDSIQSLKAAQKLKPEPSARKDFAGVIRSLQEFFCGTYRLLCKWFSLLKQSIAHFIGIAPSNVQALFSYYLWWGSYIGLKKHSHETPREYLERLKNSFAADNSELLASLWQLTLAHEKLCYGGCEPSLGQQEIKKLFSVLVAHKRIEKKQIVSHNFNR